MMTGRNKRTAAAVLLTVLVCLLFTGCAPKNAKDLAKQTAAKLVKVTSLSADEDLTMDVGIGVEGLTMDITMGMETTMDAVISPAAVHMESDMTIEAFGNSGTTHVTTYSREEGEAIATYSSMDGSAYERQEIPKDQFDSGTGAVKDLYQGIIDGTIEAELREGTEEYNGAEVYVMDLVLKGDTLEGFAGLAMAGLGENGFSLEEVDWSGCEVPVTLYVDKKTKLPARMTMDCRSLGDSIFESVAGELGGAIVNVKTFEVEIRFRDYNQVESIAFPEEIG